MTVRFLARGGCPRGRATTRNLFPAPDVTRIFPSDWRSTTMVTLSPVASFSRAFRGESADIRGQVGQR
jgi:hypothetical protein